MSAEPRLSSVLGSFVKALRLAAPDLEFHHVPIDHLPIDPSTPRPRVAVPLSLTNHGDVARAVANERLRDADLLAAPALGPDWTLAEICVRRLVDSGAHQSDTIVLGVVGSDDPAVIADYSRAAQLLSAVWGGPVHIGSVDGCDTHLGDAIDIARAYGKRVVVASYVLAAGETTESLRASGADLVTAPIIDSAAPDPRLIRLVLDRCRDALRRGMPQNSQVLL